MAMDHRETIEQVKAESERLTAKRIKEHQEELKRQAQNDAQEPTNATKKA